MFSSFGLMFERGVFEVDMERTLNKKFPEVHARSVDELIAEGWGAEKRSAQGLGSLRT